MDVVTGRAFHSVGRALQYLPNGRAARCIREGAGGVFQLTRGQGRLRCGVAYSNRVHMGEVIVVDRNDGVCDIDRSAALNLIRGGARRSVDQRGCVVDSHRAIMTRQAGLARRAERNCQTQGIERFASCLSVGLVRLAAHGMDPERPVFRIWRMVDGVTFPANVCAGSADPAWRTVKPSIGVGVKIVETAHDADGRSGRRRQER